MEATLISQIKEDSTYEYLVQQVESHPVSKRHITLPTTIMRSPRQTSTKPSNPDCNRLRNGQQQQKTSFNLYHSNPSNGRATSYSSTNPNWYTITKNVKQKTKMELILNKQCICHHNKEHNDKDCRKQQAKQAMLIAAQALSIRRELRSKGFNKEKIKALTKFKVTEPKSADFRKVLVKTNGHRALAVVDGQTQEEDLIDSKFVHLYRIPTRVSETKTVTTAIEESLERFDNECTIQ